MSGFLLWLLWLWAPILVEVANSLLATGACFPLGEGSSVECDLRLVAQKPGGTREGLPEGPAGNLWYFLMATALRGVSVMVILCGHALCLGLIFLPVLFPEWWQVSPVIMVVLGHEVRVHESISLSFPFILAMLTLFKGFSLLNPKWREDRQEMIIARCTGKILLWSEIL